MKTIIIGINSKYIHSSLAAWYLKASCDEQCGEVKVMEFTINDNSEYVLSRIYAEGCDVAAFPAISGTLVLSLSWLKI